MKQRYKEINLAVAVRPNKVFTYYATGRGEFPYDMLRYDSAWPSSSDDAVRLIQNRERRTVKLTSYSRPTPERWLSFLWSISEEDPL